jgi:hypothetical protein
MQQQQQQQQQQPGFAPSSPIAAVASNPIGGSLGDTDVEEALGYLNGTTPIVTTSTALPQQQQQQQQPVQLQMQMQQPLPLSQDVGQQQQQPMQMQIPMQQPIGQIPQQQMQQQQQAPALIQNLQQQLYQQTPPHLYQQPSQQQQQPASLSTTAAAAAWLPDTEDLQAALLAFIAVLLVVALPTADSVARILPLSVTSRIVGFDVLLRACLVAVVVVVARRLFGGTR